MPLATSANFVDPDAAYRLLVEAHRGLSDAESVALNARLVLVLANHIGNPAVLAQAIALARQAGKSAADASAAAGFRDDG